MIPVESVFSSLEAVQTFVFAAALAMARMQGMLLTMALFTRIRMAGLLSTAVALAFCVPLFPATVDIVQQGDLTGPMILAFGMKEMLVGAALGFAMSVPFLAAEAAGDILDLQRGVTMGVLIDPMMTRQTSPSGTLFGIVIVAIFIASGGLTIVLDSVYQSYEVWPAASFSPIFSINTVTVLLDLLTSILLMAITLAFPIIIVMLLSDVILAFIARSAPHLNVFTLSLILKTFVYSGLTVLYCAFMLVYMKDNLGFFDALPRLMGDIGCRRC